MSLVLDGTSGITGNSGTLLSNSTIGVGAATPAASGAGISFPATQSASSDVNTLDDYEEGTWTPTIEGTSSAGTATYATRVGNYTKVGKVVYFQFILDWSGGTGTGNLQISGLPFTSANTAFPITCQADSLTLTASNYVLAVVNGNNTTIAIQSVAVGTNPSLASVAYDAAAYLRGEGFYFV